MCAPIGRTQTFEADHRLAIAQTIGVDRRDARVHRAGSVPVDHFASRRDRAVDLFNRSRTERNDRARCTRDDVDRKYCRVLDDDTTSAPARILAGRAIALDPGHNGGPVPRGNVYIGNGIWHPVIRPAPRIATA